MCIRDSSYLNQGFHEEGFALEKKGRRISNEPRPHLRLDGTHFEEPSWCVLVEGLRCLTYLQDPFNDTLAQEVIKEHQ